MARQWTDGNKFTLLENGEAFYPRVFEVIAAARHEVLLETFILYEDKVGLQLQAALVAAAQRGAQVDITIDGFGSPDLSEEFIATLTTAGVRVHIFDPATKLFGQRLNWFRRLHRKLVAVDGVIAFIGGINYSADHLADFGPEAKQDYAVEAEGPIVACIRDFMRTAIEKGKPGWRWPHWRRTRPVPAALPRAGDARALFVWRDNRRHTNDIERHYRLAIRLARRRVMIANAYFFPGYRFLKELRKAARRGVEVSLILQGNPDLPIVQTAAAMLYHHLLRANIHIYEYLERPLHGKVAVVDEDWATVGSSNLDPLSLSLNLEANVFILDRGFNQQLADNLEGLIKHSCRKVEAADLRESSLWRLVRSFFLFHFLRRFPTWAGWLPAHGPRLTSVPPPALPEGADRVNRTAGS
ncbi:cardiolipin synthase ClsB [Noviherbaspirillum massiliense]|uniref:cardiolipin synthase ClsB n=1 Tax=Noviherbaspirillum massiliense TaxID=1465823 RepID=UPI00037F0B1F|nr:cardiolipin synthase ClsB [Noviherbaspirillum massiliense]